jgi:hypothetical protein
MKNNTNKYSGGKGNYYTVKPAELLTVNKNPVAATDGDSPILMEARLSETINSVNQLISSNAHLDGILQEEHDADLMEALEENDALIRRKIEECTIMRRKLFDAGVQSSLDVPVYNGSIVLKLKDKKDDDGIYL